MSFILSLFLCVFTLGAAAAAQEAGRQAMEPARHRIVSADFVQIRHLTELDMEVEAHGSMICELDGRLRWQVDAPVKCITLIDRETLTHYDGETGRIAVIPQEKFPWLKLLRESLDDWLTGDPERLAERFEVTLPQPGKLHLIPRDAALKKFCETVDLELVPEGDAIRRFRIAEPAGDTLEIRFSEVVNSPQLPPGVWRMPTQ